MYSHRPAHLGAWWNSISDLVGDIESIAGGGSSRPPGTLPPGARLPGGQPNIPFTTPTDPPLDDQGIIRAWVSLTRAAGGVATRMPDAATDPAGDSGNVGQLAERYTGPGTSQPNASAPLLYYLAPTQARDADGRLLAALGTDLNNPTLHFLQSLGLAPGTAGNGPPVFTLGNLQTVLLWGGVGLAALVVVPALLERRR